MPISSNHSDQPTDRRAQSVATLAAQPVLPSFPDFASLDHARTGMGDDEQPHEQVWSLAVASEVFMRAQAYPAALLAAHMAAEVAQDCCDDCRGWTTRLLAEARAAIAEVPVAPDLEVVRVIGTREPTP